MLDRNEATGRRGWPLVAAFASYGFFASTGRYEAGADDNLGLGMWSHELAAGVTAYLDEAKSWSLARPRSTRSTRPRTGSTSAPATG